jgi:hypothetical protein
MQKAKFKKFFSFNVICIKKQRILAIQLLLYEDLAFKTNINFNIHISVAQYIDLLIMYGSSTFHVNLN